MLQQPCPVPKSLSTAKKTVQPFQLRSMETKRYSEKYPLPLHLRWVGVVWCGGWRSFLCIYKSWACFYLLINQKESIELRDPEQQHAQTYALL